MMKKIIYLIFLYLLLSSSLVFAGVSSATAYGPSNKVLAGKEQTTGKIIIASRASGVISDIDTPSDPAIGAIGLPAGGNPPEPICTVSMQENRRVSTGDRANNGVVVFDACDFSPVVKVPQAPGSPTCTLCGPK